MKTSFFVVALASVAVAQADDAKRIFREERFLRGDENVRKVQPIDEAAWIWADVPADWGAACIGHAARADRDVFTPRFFRFRRRFSSTGGKLRFDVSADERFILFLDGEEIARGPHRGMPERWFFQSYEMSLAAGEHVLEAVVWQLGGHAPLAQLSWRGGFILKAEGTYDAQLTTGKAAWTVAELHGTRMTGKGESRAWGVGSECEVTGTSFYAEIPDAAEFHAAKIVRPALKNDNNGLRTEGWLLFPSALPDQMRVRRRPGAFKAVRADAFGNAPFAAADASSPYVASLNALLSGARPVKIPPNTSVRAIWDLGDYYCAYPELVVAGGTGAEVRWKWTESLLDANGRKGDRAAFDGKTIGKPFGDRFLPDGRSHGLFTSPWWRCGRWCQLEIKTADAPIDLVALSVIETRYPAGPQAYFECDDATIPDIRRICTRALQMCSHEMFFDCPYYEQQMYPGDTRVQMLATGALHADDRLVRQSMTLLGEAQRPNGFIPMNFPSRMTQESGTYTMCWVDMFRDYMMWRDGEAFVRARMPGVRRALDGLAAYETAAGLLGRMPGWSFTDYTRPWRNGLPPYGKKDGLSAIENLQYLHALQNAAAVETALGGRHFAEHYAEKATTLARNVLAAFWCSGRGLMADTTDLDSFSEQVQSLAVITGILDPGQRESVARALADPPEGMTPATVYFSHYLFDALFALGRSDVFFKRLDLWRRYVSLNMSTLQESPGQPTRDPRSDCHAWGAHPLYHLQAHVAGVQPAKPFFRTVRVAPQPGPLAFIKSGTPTPAGLVEENLRFSGGKVEGVVKLPRGMTGTFVWKKDSVPLNEGENIIRF